MDDDRAADAVDHLQAAALELIEAARAFLDVVEEMVSDRDRLHDLADSMGEIAAAAGRLVHPQPAPEAGPTDAGPARTAPTSRVEPIPVS